MNCEVYDLLPGFLCNLSKWNHGNPSEITAVLKINDYSLLQTEKAIPGLLKMMRPYNVIIMLFVQRPIVALGRPR